MSVNVGDDPINFDFPSNGTLLFGVTAELGIQGKAVLFSETGSSSFSFSAQLTLPPEWGNVTVFGTDQFGDNMSISDSLGVCAGDTGEGSITPCTIQHHPQTDLIVNLDEQFSATHPGESAVWNFDVIFEGTNEAPEPGTGWLMLATAVFGLLWFAFCRCRDRKLLGKR